MALPFAFLLPSASARALSSGWQIDRAWTAAHDTTCYALIYVTENVVIVNLKSTKGSRTIPADSLEKTPKACVLSTHFIFIPPSLRQIEKQLVMMFFHSVFNKNVLLKSQYTKYFSHTLEKHKYK